MEYFKIRLIACLLALYLSYKILFGNIHEFVKALLFWVKPDYASALDDELREDLMAELKLVIMAASVIGVWFLSGKLIN